MSADTRARHYGERTIRQVRLDCTRALVRARFCPERSDVIQVRCVDDQTESEDRFGNQLWYFEGNGVDQYDRHHRVFGVVEYSLQFGINELVEDHVFDSSYQREKFRNIYNRELQIPTWRHPAHRWLLAGLITVASIWLMYLLVLNLTA